MFHYIIPTQVFIVGIALFSFISFGEVEAAADVFDQNEGFQVAVPDTIHGSVGKHVKYQHPLGRPKIKGTRTKPAVPVTESIKETLLPPYYPTDTLFGDNYKPWGAAKLPTNPPNQVILDKIDDELFNERSEIHSYDQMRHEETRNSLRW